MPQNTYGIYVRTDDKQRVVAINSEGLLPSLDGWTRIGTYESDVPYAQGDALGGPIMTDEGIYRYKLIDGVAVERSPEEMAADDIPRSFDVGDTELALIELAGMVSDLFAAQAELAALIEGGEM